jgi:hypothetical protein
VTTLGPDGPSFRPLKGWTLLTPIECRRRRDAPERPLGPAGNHVAAARRHSNANRLVPREGVEVARKHITNVLTIADIEKIGLEKTAEIRAGGLTPHLGGGTFRYDPPPSNFVSRRRQLRFVYFDGTTLRGLSYAELREIESGG